MYTERREQDAAQTDNYVMAPQEAQGIAHRQDTLPVLTTFIAAVRAIPFIIDTATKLSTNFSDVCCQPLEIRVIETVTTSNVAGLPGLQLHHKPS